MSIEINLDVEMAKKKMSLAELSQMISGVKQALNLGIRCVTYNGAIQQLSARLDQGQTTNLRTVGGGLATVFPTPEGSCCA